MSPPTRRSLLFTTREGGDNIPPVLTLVRTLVARGHDVRLTGDACTRAAAEAAGATFLPWTLAPSRAELAVESDPMRDWEASEPAEVIRRMVARLICGTALLYARDVLAALDAHLADAIVTSEMLFGPMIACEAAGVPVAALGCNIPIVPLPGVPPFGPGLAPARRVEERALHAAIQGSMAELLGEGLPALNDACRALDLPPLSAIGEQFERLDRYLVATAQAFDFPADALPPNLLYVGPLMDEPVWAAGDSAPTTDDERPLVLVAFSTTYQQQEAALQRIFDALAALPVRAVVTTGPMLTPVPSGPRQRRDRRKRAPRRADAGGSSCRDPRRPRHRHSRPPRRSALALPADGPGPE